MTRLFVNVDHVATIREARRTQEPDPLKAALMAEKMGADGITVHLREDRRHIQDKDLRIIHNNIGTKLNRLLIFICEEKEKHDLDETQVKQLKKLLFLQCENGTLNKANDVDYSDETYHIVSIKNLEYNEKDYCTFINIKKDKKCNKFEV